jgi:hypothetical protein
MKNRILLFVCISAAALLAACKEDKTNDTVVPPAADPFLFSDSGFTFIHLGDSLVWATITVPEGVVKDTVFEQITAATKLTEADTVAWNAKIVRHPDGKVILESEFETFAMLGRAQIESPRYKNKEGIHVGSTVADLKTAYPDLIVKPFGAYKVFEIVHSRQIFHIPMVNAVPDDSTITIDQLPPGEKISRIVIMQ